MKKYDAFERAYLKALGLIKEDVEDLETTDVEISDELPAGAEGEEEKPMKKVCFMTSDEDLINAISNGFEEVVFFVKSEDENGEETVEEVKVKGDSFGDVDVTEVCPECGEDPCVCDGAVGDDAEADDDEEEIEECGEQINEMDDDFIEDPEDPENQGNQEEEEIPENEDED